MNPGPCGQHRSLMAAVRIERLWRAVSIAACGGMLGGGFAGLASVLPTRVFGVMSAGLLIGGCIWFGLLTARAQRETRRHNYLLTELLQHLASRDAAYEYRLVWGSDRRAAGPLELRRCRTSGVVEWRYGGSAWTEGRVPGEIASLFESLGGK